MDCLKETLLVAVSSIKNVEVSSDGIHWPQPLPNLFESLDDDCITVSGPLALLLKNEEKWVNPDYDPTQEMLSSLTHGVGLGMCLPGAALLLTLGAAHGDPWLQAGLVLYSFSLILLYLASTLYHAAQDPIWKRRFRKLDHISIYLFIAGIYAPLLLGNERTPLGWAVLAVVLAIAIIGSLWKAFFLGKFEVLAIVSYIIMGAAGLVIIKDLIAMTPLATIEWLVVGGAIYAIGLIFYGSEKIPYNHVVWHLFVMAASAAQFIAILSLLR